MGRALGRGFARRGGDVRHGARTPDELREWFDGTGGSVSVGTFGEAAHGEIVVLALLGVAAEDAVELAGQEHFAGRVVLDATDPLVSSGGTPPHLLIGGRDAPGEGIQARLADARARRAPTPSRTARWSTPPSKRGRRR